MQNQEKDSTEGLSTLIAGVFKDNFSVRTGGARNLHFTVKNIMLSQLEGRFSLYKLMFYVAKMFYLSNYHNCN